MSKKKNNVYLLQHIGSVVDKNCAPSPYKLELGTFLGSYVYEFFLVTIFYLAHLKKEEKNVRFKMI